MLNAEERLKEAAEFAAFGIASHVLQSIPMKEPVEMAVGQVHDIVGWGIVSVRKAFNFGTGVISSYTSFKNYKVTADEKQ